MPEREHGGGSRVALEGPGNVLLSCDSYNGGILSSTSYGIFVAALYDVVFIFLYRIVVYLSYRFRIER